MEQQETKQLTAIERLIQQKKNDSRKFIDIEFDTEELGTITFRFERIMSVAEEKELTDKVIERAKMLLKSKTNRAAPSYKILQQLPDEAIAKCVAMSMRHVATDDNPHLSDIDFCKLAVGAYPEWSRIDNVLEKGLSPRGLNAEVALVDDLKN